MDITLFEKYLYWKMVIFKELTQNLFISLLTDLYNTSYSFTYYKLQPVITNYY